MDAAASGSAAAAQPPLGHVEESDPTALAAALSPELQVLALKYISSALLRHQTRSRTEPLT